MTRQNGIGDSTASAVITLRPPAAAMVIPGGAPDRVGMVNQHLSLVEILVNERMRTVPAHIRRDDLVSAGMLALVLSAVAFDPDRGSSFRSFAAFRIRGALIDELRGMDWASRSVRSRAREIEAARCQLVVSQERAPSNDEIAAAAGISTRELDALQADLARGNVLSLQGLVVDSAADVASDHATGPEALILRREQLGYLHDAIAALPERLRFVVEAYFFSNRQMSEIALELSITQSRVSQLCTEAISLIRDALNSQLDPDAVRARAQTGRAANARTAYYRAVAGRNTVAGRLAMSNRNGEMRLTRYPDLEETQRIA